MEIRTQLSIGLGQPQAVDPLVGFVKAALADIRSPSQLVEGAADLRGAVALAIQVFREGLASSTKLLSGDLERPPP